MKALLLILPFLAGSGQAHAEEKVPVTLSIRAKAKRVCLGESMTVIASIRNISPAPVVIDTKGIGTTPRFSWRHKTGPREYDIGVFTEFTTRSSSKKDSLVLLYPLQSFSAELSYPLKLEWLPRSGKYEFQAGYSQYQDAQHEGLKVWNGNVDSNKIGISVKMCREGRNRWPQARLGFSTFIGSIKKN
jgi:hypothetical protein